MQYTKTADAAAGRVVSDKPIMDVPRRKYLPIVGTLNPTELRTTSKNTELEIQMLEEAELLRAKLESRGYTDRHAMMQQTSAPAINAGAFELPGAKRKECESIGTRISRWDPEPET